MKKILFQRLAHVAMSLSACGAFAAPVTVTSGSTTGIQIVEPSYGQIKISPTGIGMMNALKIRDFSASNGASVTLAQRTHPVTGVTSWTSLAFNTSLQTFTFDDGSKALLNEAFKGSIKLVAPSATYLTTGGELTISDLRVDFQTKTVYATVIGANGVGSRVNVALWGYSSISGNQAYPGGNIQTTLSPLQLTADGFNIWAQSLGYTHNGRVSLNSVNQQPTGFGSLTVTVSTNGTLPPPVTCENPSTAALAPSPF